MFVSREGKFLLCFVIVLMVACCTHAEIRTYKLDVRSEISVAEISIEGGVKHPLAALILCPGQNGSSKGLLEQRTWREFARRERLVLVGIHFQSSEEDLKSDRGYYVASRGSGALLEEGLAKAGLGNLPLLLYGFSGGAHFARSYASYRPDRVKAFCAYSFAWSSPPAADLGCPALIVCGEEDGTRYGSTLEYFQSGRNAGKPWTWVSLKETPHRPHAGLDDFVRAYFSAILAETPKSEVRVDNMSERVMTNRADSDVATSVLPSEALLEAWKEIHHP
ncbi:MAG TPA: hypothetical protein PLS03_14820 [Terrimicrobiaceae bacterium]|nr:hypothetical protein [Terrimicrobiaceae bacterium]